jgi:hypothetical protein
VVTLSGAVTAIAVVTACGSGLQSAQPLSSRYESATGNAIIRGDDPYPNPGDGEVQVAGFPW